MRLPPFLYPLFAIALFAGAEGGMSARQPVASDPPARYRVTASVDEAARRIRGVSRVEWQNPTGVPVSEIRLLTAWNARRDTRSTWAREREAAEGAAPAGIVEAPGSTEFMAVKVTEASRQVDRLAALAVVAPDDGNSSDGTVWTLPLDVPLRGGQRIELELAWVSRIPDLGEGFGARRGVFLAAEWLPRVALFTEDGWHAHQSHYGNQPPAAFGTFDVDLRLPSTWIVGATGPEIARQDHGDGTTTRRFHATNVTDFAWAASASFVERSYRIEQPGAEDIDLRLLLQPEHAVQSERHRNAAAVALETYNQWLGAYPWPALTIVDVPEPSPARERPATSGLIGTAPGLIAVNTPWITPWSIASPDAAIMTGIGEEFWRHATGVDAIDTPALAHGLSMYVTTRMMRERFGGRYVSARRYFHGLMTWPYIDAGITALAVDDPFATRRNEQPDSEVLTLVTFERTFGWEITRSTLASYLSRGLFRHPTAREFTSVASSEAGRDVSWSLGAWKRTAARVDYAVASVSSAPSDHGTFESTIDLARVGDGRFPVHALVTFTDGSSVVENWDGVESAHTLRYERRSPVESVAIDPDHLLALDTNRTNNSWSSRPAGSLAAVKWASRWASWFQHVLVTYAFFV